MCKVFNKEHYKMVLRKYKINNPPAVRTIFSYHTKAVFLKPGVATHLCVAKIL